MINKHEVNQAIYVVLTTQYKKDAKKAHSIVEAAGYQITKFNGDWHIRNDKTGRTVYIHYPKYNSRSYREYIDGNGNGKKAKISRKFNFVGYLEKPLNTAWREMKSYSFQENRYSQQATFLKSKRWNVKYHTDAIAEIQKKMEDLQKQLIYHAGEKVKSEQALLDVRKSLGLVK